LCKKRYLVTGVTGFVGAHLARRLLDLGYEVYGFMRRRADGQPPSRLVERGVYGQVTLLDGDIQNLPSVISALERAEPDVVFHLAAQSYIPRSFKLPLETYETNTVGTLNLLEAVRIKDYDPKIIFAGSSEEYGFQSLDELPINEDNALRPLSPYAVSKVHGDFMMQNYHRVYGLRTIVSRAFNHEGYGRGDHFVTATIARQCVSLFGAKSEEIVLGNVNPFRDWSHVEDIVNGYILLSKGGIDGDVYVQGSNRTNSVLTFLLLALRCSDAYPQMVETFNGGKQIADPLEVAAYPTFNPSAPLTEADAMLLSGEVEYGLEDGGLYIDTDRGRVQVRFDASRFRPADVPILFSDPRKIEKLGFEITHSLEDIVREQLDYYRD
jgi:GDP-mannose 4,6-dehydratase